MSESETDIPIRGNWGFGKNSLQKKLEEDKGLLGLGMNNVWWVGERGGDWKNRVLCLWPLKLRKIGQGERMKERKRSEDWRLNKEATKIC